MTTRRVLVCGAGSIGRRHLANLRALGAEVLMWRARPELLNEVAGLGAHPCANLTEGIAASDAVIVATATDQHVSIAVQALRAGKALFIEKPLAHQEAAIRELLAAAKGDPVIEVGCQLRAHPNLQALASAIAAPDSGAILTYRLAMGHRLDAWRPTSDYRLGYSADAARGGGALFDLIHQVDIALWLFGAISSVQASLTRRSDLVIRGDDVTNLLLDHQAGFTGHIQVDMASPVYRCDAEVVAANAVYRWSMTEGVLLRRTAAGEEIAHRAPESFTRNDLFMSHMRYFLRRIEDRALPPMCSLGDGVSAVRVALAARAAHETGCRTAPESARA